MFHRGARIECSRKTGRIRHVYVDNKLVATLRHKDGFLALTPAGAQLVLSRVKNPPNVVVVDSSVGEEIRGGGDVFAKHILRADKGLRPGEEVIVTDEAGHLLGVGAAGLSGHEMPLFKRGVAVNLRKAVAEASHADGE